MSLCTVRPSNSHISSLSMAILALGKAKVTGSQIWVVRGLTDLGDAMLCPKSLHKSCKMGRCIVVMKLPVTTWSQLWLFSSYCSPQPAKDLNVVLLSYCLAWRSVLVVDNNFMVKKKKKNFQHALDVDLTLLRLLWTWTLRRLPLGRKGFCFRVIATDPRLISGYNLFGEMWVFVSGFKQVLGNFST